MKFKVSKKQRRMVEKWLKTEPKVPPPELYYCFSMNSGIGVACDVVNKKTGNSIDVTDYTTW